MVQRVEAYMRGHGLFSPSGRLLCAVSGGADSVALLRMMLAIRKDLSVTVAACHFEHGIRGEPSLGDMEFVRALCETLEVPLYLERGRVPELAKVSNLGLETAARQARRAFYGRAMEQMDATELALGHHMDDQAETVLMHMARGARGAVGMAPRAGKLVRPLLCLRKEEILDYLSQLGQEYCTDDTNAAEDNPRNILRARVMPPLTQVYPGAARAFFRAAEYMAQDDGYLREQALGWMDVDQDGQLCYRELPPMPLLRRALLEYAARAGAEAPGSTGLERLVWLTRAHTGARVEIGGVAFARTRKGILALGSEAPIPERPLQVPGITPWRGGCFEATLGSESGFSDGLTVQTLDADQVPPLTLRARRPGDRLFPLGAPGSKKLKEILIDRGIPRGLRDSMPLLVHGSTVYWMPGLPPSELGKVGPETKNFIRIAYFKNADERE